MKKMVLPLSVLLLLTACSNNEAATEPESEESETEVSAPQDEFDPTDTEEVEEAQPVTFEALANGEIEEGTPVTLTGTIEELTDDGAFPAFILSDGEVNVFVRNMAETAVQLGSTVSIEGIYDGDAEENMPFISATVIE